MTSDPGGAPQRCDLLVRNATLLTVDERDGIVLSGALAVAGGRFVAVGPERDVLRAFTARDVVDAGGAVVHPGFIDAHIHVSQYTARTVVTALDRAGLTQGHWKAELRPEDEEASAMLAAVDYLKAGYTGFVDPGTIFEPDAVAPVAERAGIRIWLTDPYVADRRGAMGSGMGYLLSDGFLARWPRDLDQALARLGSQLFRNEEAGLVRAFVGLYGENTESPELHRAAVDLARARGVQFQEHLGYVPGNLRDREARLGRPLLADLEDRGLLGADVTFIHMNAVRSGEVARLARHGVRVVWCPYSQLQMIGRGGAEPRMTALLRAGCPVGLATDIPRTVDFDALGSCATAAGAASGDPMTYAEILRCRTIGAAASVGAQRWTGSLEAGKQADFVIREPTASEAFGFDVALESAILGGRFSVRAVYVGGRPALLDGTPVHCDAGRAIDAARRSALGIASRIGLAA